MSGSHCFCVPPVLACVCFSCACTSRKRTLHQYTDGETQHAACACPAQPASACGPATRRTRARVASAPRSCSNCMHFRLGTSGESSSLDNFCPQNQTHMLDVALHACFLGVVVACRINCPQKLEKFGASAQGFSNRRRRPVAAARLVLLNFFFENTTSRP